MTEYFIPDRSDRPVSEDNQSGKVTELFRDGTLAGKFSDGRPLILEPTLVDGFAIHWFYFDIRGLENASVDELRRLIETALGRPILFDLPESAVACWATRKKDAQGRDIWEFAAMDMQGD